MNGGSSEQQDLLSQKLANLLGGRTATALERAFGHRTAGDLLAHYPRRYVSRGELTALSELPIGENVTIIAEVREVRERPMRQRRGSLLEVKISDGNGILTLTFFGQPWRANELTPGVRGIFAGKVSEYRGALQLAHPDYELFDRDKDGYRRMGVADETGAVPEPEAEEELSIADREAEARRWAETPIPIYPATASLASWQLQKAVAVVLDAVGAATLPDPVPSALRSRRGLLPFGKAIEQIHRPANTGQWRSAIDALKFQEAFVLQCALVQQQHRLRALPGTARVPSAGGLLDDFDAALPFQLTGDQRKVGAEIAADLGSESPMNRLVQGEVGSGKTLVALRAMLTVAESDGQSALLAPTEVLAAQHFRSIVRSLGPDLSAQLMPTLLTGQLGQAERKKAMLRIVSGQARIVVGTHALLSDTVQFYDLGLVVVDEQHRFGVDQREALRVKGISPPHVLVLTATPIPRTVAMTVFGDLDVSTIRELPAGRQGIESFVVQAAERPAWLARTWQRVAEEVAKGHQAFIVCPAIEPKAGGEAVPEDDGGLEDAAPDPADPAAAKRPLTTVTGLVDELRAKPEWAGLRVAPLHSRMDSEVKEQTMLDFAAGRIDVLVATTVIEVGVDVPNASAMVVMDADRFGVSQLHQLRGRVGRGGVPGLCLLVTYAAPDSIALERVEAVAETLDGFELAQVDLQLRREGNVLGNTQSGGASSLKLLRVVTDVEIIVAAREEAESVVGSDPELEGHPVLAGALARRLDESERAFLVKG